MYYCALGGDTKNDFKFKLYESGYKFEIVELKAKMKFRFFIIRGFTPTINIY